MKEKKALLIGAIIIVLLAILVIVNLRIMFNPYYTSGLPQEHFIEIRPIVYGWPTDEMRQAQDAGEIILGGDAYVSPAPKYVILIKSEPKESQKE